MLVEADVQHNGNLEMYYPRMFKFIFQIDQTLETINHNLILVLPQGVNKYLQLHQHHYTSHLLCH